MLNLWRKFVESPLAFVGIILIVVLLFITPPLAVLLIGIAAWLNSLLDEQKPSYRVDSYNKPSGMFMSADAKTRYLASDEWKTKRLARLQIDNYQCANCSSTTNLNIHHITYERLGYENIDTDLLTLCKTCHHDLHKIAGYDRKSYYPLSILKESSND